MEDKFYKAPCLLTHINYRLFVEDFLLLSPGDIIVGLISKKHEWLQNKTSKKKWIDLLKQCW